MEISFRNKNKNSTFRSSQSMICYVTNWRIINVPLKLELYLSNFRVYFHPFFRLRCQMKNHKKILFRSNVRQKQSIFCSCLNTRSKVIECNKHYFKQSKSFILFATYQIITGGMAFPRALY